MAAPRESRFGVAPKCFARSKNRDGSGGLRNIGFNRQQVSNILHYATLIQKRLKP